MKNLSKIFFTIAFFCISAICVSAQQTSLENTLWVATPPPYFTRTYIKSASAYTFGQQNKVKLRVDYIEQTINPPTFNYYTHNLETHPPTIGPGQPVFAEGTYKKTGNSIRMEFPEHIITATIKDNVMSGEFTVKSTNEKIKWIAVKDAPQKESAGSRGINPNDVSKISNDPNESQLIPLSVQEAMLKFQSQITGAWRYIEYDNNGIKTESFNIPPTLKMEITNTFSSGSIFTSDVRTLLGTTPNKYRWEIYHKKSDYNGIVILYLDDEMFLKLGINLIDNNSYEETILFSKVPSYIGTKKIFRRVL